MCIKRPPVWTLRAHSSFGTAVGVVRISQSCCGTSQLVRIVDVEPTYAFEGGEAAAAHRDAEDEANARAAVSRLSATADAFRSPFRERVIVGWRRKADYQVQGFNVFSGAEDRAEYTELDRRQQAGELTWEAMDAQSRLLPRKWPQPVSGTKFLGFQLSPESDPLYEGRIEATHGGETHCPKCNQPMSQWLMQMDGMTVPIEYAIPLAVPVDDGDWRPVGSANGAGQAAGSAPTAAASASASASSARSGAARAAAVPLRAFNLRTGLSDVDHPSRPRLPRGPVGHLWQCAEHRECWGVQWRIHKPESYSS